MIKDDEIKRRKAECKAAGKVGVLHVDSYDRAAGESDPDGYPLTVTDAVADMTGSGYPVLPAVRVVDLPRHHTGCGVGCALSGGACWS